MYVLYSTSIPDHPGTDDYAAPYASEPLHNSHSTAPSTPADHSPFRTAPGLRGRCDFGPVTSEGLGVGLRALL